MGRLDNKTALVTGASRGIGRAVAVELAREGAKVAVNYQSNDAKAKEVADEIKKLGGACLLVKANLADPKEARGMVKRVADQFGHLDILVNNAGITRDKLLPKMTDEDWLEVIQTNLNAMFFCTSAAIPFMTAQSYGRIVNISSMNGQVGAIGQANYSASKGGIIAFTRTAAAGAGEGRHHGQQRVAWLHRDRHVRQGARRPADADQGPDPSGSLRPAGGDCPDSDLPGHRRRLRHRADHRRQRRCAFIAHAGYLPLAALRLPSRKRLTENEKERP